MKNGASPLQGAQMVATHGRKVSWITCAVIAACAPIMLCVSAWSVDAINLSRYRQLVGKTPDEVIAIVGQPIRDPRVVEGRAEEDEFLFAYYPMTSPGRIVRLQFKDGVVHEVAFDWK